MKELGLKTKVSTFFKKLFAIVLSFFMMSSYISVFTNISDAANLNSWWTYNRRYNGYIQCDRYNWGVWYNKNTSQNQRYLFTDTDPDESSRLKDLYCIRSGDSQDSNYMPIDLYNLDNASVVVNDLGVVKTLTGAEIKANLFGENGDGDRKYNHFMWILENMYAVTTNQANEIDRFNNSIGAEAAPYDASATVTSNFMDSMPGSITTTKNEMLLKVVQNEILSKYVKQTNGIEPNFWVDESTTTFGTTNQNQMPYDENTDAYVKKMLEKLDNMDNSEGYSVDTSMSKGYDGRFSITNEPGTAVFEERTSDIFTVNNPDRGQVQYINVFVNGGSPIASNLYTVINADNDDIISDLGAEISQNDSLRFKIKYDESLVGDGNTEVSIQLGVRYDNITKATLFIPKTMGYYWGNEVRHNQIVINVERSSTSKSYSVGSVVENKIFDLALTKQIMSVSGAGEIGLSFDGNNSRLKNIDTANLDIPMCDKNNNDARYFMDKTPVSVKSGNKVKYRISVYNEGQIDGYAEEIRDYLPIGLTFDNESTVNGPDGYNWTVVEDTNGKVIKTDYLSKSKGEERGEDTKLKAYQSGTDIDKKYVEVECYVANSVNEGDSLDNRAEISCYGYYLEDSDTWKYASKEIDSDYDSIQDTVLDTNDETVKKSVENMLNEIPSIIAGIPGYRQNGGNKNMISYQDDDDIERLTVVEDNKWFDLALRKWIKTVNDTDYTDTREPPVYKIYNFDLDELDDDYRTSLFSYAQRLLTMKTLQYDHDKKVVDLYAGDIVTYKIAVFNEGLKDGYADEVTDYIPSGLRFLPDNQTNIDNGWYVDNTVNAGDGVTVVKTEKYKHSEGATLNDNIIYTPLGSATTHAAGINDEKAVKVLEIVCEVTEDAPTNTYLTNRAEITKYGYFKDNGDYVEADKTIEKYTDRDSKQNTIIDDGVRLDNWYTDHFDSSSPQEYIPGDEDDDDFETVRVRTRQGSYNLEVQKVDTARNPISTNIIKRVFTSTLNGNALQIKSPSGSAAASSVKYKTIKIENTDQDIILVEESEAPAGYAKFEYKIKIYVDKIVDGDKYYAYFSRVEVLNPDGTVRDYVDNPRVIIGGDPLGNCSADFADCSVSYSGKGNIKVQIENPKIDVALKKSITKVSHNDGAFVDVTTANGFNVGRYDATKGECIIPDTSTLDNSTNAEYNMIKKPVQVYAGDKVEYVIKIYNEGEVPAGASVIKDYIPTGLEVLNVYYKDSTTALAKDAATGNSYSYDTTTNDLTINLRDVNLIGAYSTTEGLKSDYVRVVCEVIDNASGILTNVAEIVKYYDNNKTEITKDIDSTAGNWTTEAGIQKDSEAWINYSNGQNISDGTRKNIPSQDAGIDGRKGDDDDFDKLEVLSREGDYNLEVQKVDSKENEITASDITRVFSAKLNGSDLEVSSPTGTNKSGSTVTYETINIEEIGTETIVVEETSAPEGYAKFEYKVKLYITKIESGTSYKAYVSKVELLDSSDHVVGDSYINPNTSNPTADYTFEFDGGKVIYSDGGTIKVQIQNKKIDVALKKSITKVSHNGGAFVDVTTANGFNVGRYDATKGECIIPNDSTLSNSTNAEYNMIKAPVEVCVGDKIEYVIKIYNEGEVPAGASVIKDYIPNGLEVKDVYYKNETTALTENAATGNTYSYDRTANDLTINLKNVNLIQAYSTTEGLKSDYVRVVCEVKDDASGILTNVAEIVKYYDNNKTEITKDIDSTAGNWTTEAGIQKDSEAWINYSNGQNISDGTRKNIPSFDTGLNNNKGDDDDFDKIKVIRDADYSVYLKKVDNRGQNINGVKFGISSNVPEYEEEVTTSGDATFIATNKITSDTYQTIDTYEITEIETLDNLIELPGTLKLNVTKKYNDSHDSFVIDTFTMQYGDKNSTAVNPTKCVIENIPVGNNGKTITIKAELQSMTVSGKTIKAIVITIPNEEVEKGSYNILLNKVDEEGKYLAGAEFAITGKDNRDVLLSEYITSPIETDGTANAKEIVVRQLAGDDANTTDIYTIKETKEPTKYYKLKDSIVIKVTKKVEDSTIIVDKVYVNDKEVKNGSLKLEGFALVDTDKKVNATITVSGNTITVVIENKLKEFDLALRKFICKVNDDAITGDKSREPKVDLSTLINGDPNKNGEKTATYIHPKDPVLVNGHDIVEYTLRVYNEGELDGYANLVIDDVPAEVKMVTPTYDNDGKPTNKNAEYRWVMYREASDSEKSSASGVVEFDDKFYVETNEAEKAVMIATDYLSLENGERMMKDGDTENPNLIKAFDGTTLSYKDLKVDFEVREDNDPKIIITNYAQISDHKDSDGNKVTDRDSTPNKWKNGEDDQDVEHLNVTWFDLALYKWVTKAIVTEDGKTKEYASGHTQDDKSNIVNVAIAKSKLNSTVVKFEWQVKVENQGIIEGYATELKDHIPAGLTFVEEDNTAYGWKLQPDGTITTDYLKDTLLYPGDTAEVTVVLRWINGETNLGRKINYAEISDDYNKYGSKDIDSTPDNFRGTPVEDDEDVDEVRLTVKTGNNSKFEYALIGIICLAIVSGGIVGIKKFVQF